MPPAATEDAMAGVSKTSFRRGVRNEKSNLNVGAGGGGGLGISCTSVSSCLISREERDDVRTGSWLFIAVADDDEQLL